MHMKYDSKRVKGKGIKVLIINCSLSSYRPFILPVEYQLNFTSVTEKTHTHTHTHAERLKLTFKSCGWDSFYSDGIL